MKTLLVIALIFSMLFAFSEARCNLVKNGSYLKRYSRKVSYKVPVRRMKWVPTTKRVCFNKRYRYKYTQRYRTRVRKNYRARVRYQVVVKRWRNYRTKCRRRKRKFRNQTYFRFENRRCLKKKRKCQRKYRMVPYPSKCSRMVRKKFRRRVPVKVPATCTRKVRRSRRVRRRERCTKKVRVKYWTGRYDRRGNVYCKRWAFKTVNRNGWCTVRRRVYYWVSQTYTCTKTKMLWRPFWRRVREVYNCRKFRKHYYNSCKNVNYWSTCRKRVKKTRRVGYWYYYTVNCLKKRLVKVKEWRTKLVPRTKLVWVIRTRPVYQWRWKAATKLVKSRRQVWWVQWTTKSRTQYYYRRVWRYRKVCRLRR